MTLLYSFVARRDASVSILAEYSSYSGNFATVALECLRQMDSPEEKFTIACSGHTFNFLTSNGFIYLVVAEEAYGRAIPFAFLERVKEEFETKFAEKARGALANSLDKPFRPRLKAHIEYCQDHPQEIIKVAAVQRKVADLKDIMIENIEKLRDRGEVIDLLVDKADGLNQSAKEFDQRGKAIRRAMCWQNYKWKLLILVLLLLLGLVIFLAACFGGGNNCTKSTPTPVQVPAPQPILTPPLNE